MDLPLANYATLPYDKVLSNGKPVGLSTYTGYTYNERAMVSLAIIDNALAAPDKRPVNTAHQYKADVLGRFLAWLLDPPFRTKTKTTKPFEPIAVTTKTAVITEFEQLQGALLERVRRCDGRDLERMKVVSPFNASARYNLYSALIILCAHQRRHLWQADRALERVSG